MQTPSSADGESSCKKPCITDIRDKISDISDKFSETLDDIKACIPPWLKNCPTQYHKTNPGSGTQTPLESQPLLNGLQTVEVTPQQLEQNGVPQMAQVGGQIGGQLGMGIANQFGYGGMGKPNYMMGPMSRGATPLQGPMSRGSTPMMGNGHVGWNGYSATNGNGLMDGHNNGFGGINGMNGVNGNGFNGMNGNGMNGLDGTLLDGYNANGLNGTSTNGYTNGVNGFNGMNSTVSNGVNGASQLPNGSGMMVNGNGVVNGNGKMANGATNGRVGNFWSNMLQCAPHAMNQLSIGRSPSATPVPMPPPRVSLTPGPRTPGPNVPQFKTETSSGSSNGRGNGAFDVAIVGEKSKGKRGVIDLTNDDDDDIVIVSQNIAKPIARPSSRPMYAPSPTPGPMLNINEKTVCCGMIVDCSINAHSVPHPRQGMDTFALHWPLTPFALVRASGPAEGNFVFRAVDYTRQEFGVLDIRTSRALHKLVDCKIIRLQPRLLPRKKTEDKPGEMIKDDKDKQLKLYINIYAYEASARIVGDELRKHGIRLQQPKMADENIPYKNPHADDILAVQAVQSPEHFESALNNVLLDIQGQCEMLEEMEQDYRVTTPLLKHQKQGLRFMTEHEAPVFFNYNSPTCPWRVIRSKSGAIEKFIHNETQLEQQEEPLPVTGGILADVMGLGKTLSILSLIASTLEDAREFANQEMLQAGELARLQPVLTTGATLLVTPMSTITNWEEQIKAHLSEGSVSYYVYHGAKREMDYHNLARYDIIITTYSILGGEVHKARKEYKDESYVCRTPLLQLQFYRVVLDEAHTIREQRTQQFEGAYHVKANKRWAVTGTPVQNGLKDLQALVRFLHISPYMISRNFSTYIMTPFRNADPCGLARIRKLVNSICLRRGKDKIDLPARKDNLVYLDFSTEEKELYDKIFQQSRTQVEITYRAAVQKKKLKSLGGSNYANFLQAIMKLRLVCAHGKDLLCEADMAGLSSTHAIDVDELEEKGSGLQPKQAYSIYNLLCQASSEYCSSCMQKPTRPDADACEKTFAYLTDCYHVICMKCIKDFEAAIENTITASGRYTCPLCEVHISKNAFPLKVNEVEEAIKQENSKSKRRSAYSGPSTKVKALLHDLEADRQAHLSDPNQTVAKSVVFSTWTTHLDLIAQALQDNGFPYVRLDGTMSLKLRQNAINSFREDDSCQVMLISIMAGGLGLNLTCATKAYIMEPMFNPACEAQAVDRVHRLGQKKEVTTVRYVMRDSFEEKILLLQKKKQDIANMSMGKIDKAELTAKKLSDLAEIFKIQPFP